MSRFPLISKIKTNRAREFFFSQGTVPNGLVPEAIVRSWQRSAISGVAVGQEFNGIPVLCEEKLTSLKEKNRELLKHSLPVMENLYEQITHTSSIMLLADSAGVVLHSIGDPDFVGKARKVSLQPGGIWSEELRGTNAIGTSLLEQAPMMVHNAEHFLTANHFLCCSASPIFDPHGRVLGVLDVSGTSRANHQHTMALVQISTQQIENQMFSNGFERELVLHFHVRPEFVGTLYEGIIVFSQDGNFLAANRSALLHLGVDRYQAESQTFYTLFDASIDAVFAQPGQFAQPVRQLRTGTGVVVFGRAKTRLIRVPQGSLLAAKSALATEPGTGAGGAVLEDLDLGDPGMRKIIEKARKVLGHDIPVLLEGESGTGKELFAKALHNSSPRSNGSFVALNCAALPEGLIESELFGYQEGAFTGAKRKGYPGKIRQSDGGTLFLDEIGDMPLPLQARLLRLLQERTVSPLGSTEAHKVDFALICATNRKIRAEVTAGRFREDLYYRLNGFLITLPRLQDRKDCLALARKIVDSLAISRGPVTLNQEVMEIFAHHPWPGNIRQMHNVLRTAVVLLGSDSEITAEHLSEDFLEQYQPPVALADAAANGSPDDDPTSLGSIEKQAIRRAVQEYGGNITAAARKLGISRNTLYRKMHDYAL